MLVLCTPPVGFNSHPSHCHFYYCLTIIRAVAECLFVCPTIFSTTEGNGGGIECVWRWLVYPVHTELYSTCMVCSLTYPQSPIRLGQLMLPKPAILHTHSHCLDEHKLTEFKNHRQRPGTFWNEAFSLVNSSSPSVSFPFVNYSPCFQKTFTSIN